MHSLMILMALGTAFGLRLTIPPATAKKSWQRSLFFFLFPSLILLMTALAVICMGYHGEMLGLKADWLSYLLAIAFLGFAGFKLIQLLLQTLRTRQELKRHPQALVGDQVARMIETDFPYSAQVGLWDSELVMTQGLVNLLDSEHLAAVLAHEKAHHNYRDTFWFFWLEWLRSVTCWLPKTDELWHELLFLREIRADQKASQSVDSLLLAEALLIVVEQVKQISPFNFSPLSGVAFHESNQNRLLERVNLILDEPQSGSFTLSWYNWTLLLSSLMPFFTLPLHD